MSSIEFIKAPGSTYEAKDLLKELGLSPTGSVRNLELAKKRAASEDMNDKVFGFNALWALGSIAMTGAAAAYASAIDRHVEDTELPEAQAHHYISVADYWREIAVRPFDLTSAMNATSGTRCDDDDAVQNLAVRSGGLIVVKSIGDPQSAEGRSLAARFSPLVGRPLEKLGFIPEEGFVRADIERRFPWASKAADTIERSLSLIRATNSKKSFTKPLLFVGEPGTGKTSLAMHVAGLLGRASMRLASAGTNDSATLAATPRGWANFKPSLPVQMMLESRSCDPCIIVDEVDKSSRVGGQNGSVQGTLLGMLDKPEQYYDTALMANADLSNVLFMATANSLESVNEALLDRFTVVSVPKPRAEHFDTVLAGLRANMAASLGHHPGALPHLDRDEYNALRTFFVENRGSLRKIATAYEISLGSALVRQRNAVTLM